MTHNLKISAITLFLMFAILGVEAKPIRFNFDFSTGTRGWVGDFADYNVGEEAFFELEWGWSNLPKELTLHNGKILTKGMFLSGNNHSDDLFMFIKRQIRGLKPNTFYDLTFHVLIENDVPPGQAGIGGSPGESVYFKVGASTKEPRKIDVDGFYLLNVRKGNQGQGGKNAVVVGNMANPLVDPTNPQFEPKHFTNRMIDRIRSLRAKTDNKGRLWLFVGTDSGFEGPTLYYIANIRVKATPSEPTSDS